MMCPFAPDNKTNRCFPKLRILAHIINTGTNTNQFYKQEFAYNFIKYYVIYLEKSEHCYPTLLRVAKPCLSYLSICMHVLVIPFSL